MANDIFVSNDIALDVNFGEVFVVDQGVVYRVVASKYSNTATYVVGAYVLYLEKLYRCIVAVDTPEEFNAEKWTQVLLADEVQIANANIALKANADSVYDKTAIDSKITNINNALALKANSDDVYAKADTYNKAEVDNALDTKADADTTYSKTEVDDALALKANSSSVYSKSDTDTLLNNKADKSTTYTKTEVDTALANKANSADVYTKTETYSKTEVDTDIYKKTETYNKAEVDNKIDNLPAPMIMKGTLGTGGTITDLPTASSENEGFTYKVITDGTYAGQTAKTGDVFTSAKPVGSSDYIWLYIPSGDETFTDTWRGIKVNGTEKLGSSINTGSVDFKDGTNSTAVFDPSDSSIKFNVDGYTQAQVDTKLADKANASDVYAKSETYSQAEVDSKLLNKANTSDVYTKQETYTKTEVNTALSEKADTSTVTTALALKADKADTYTKEEVDDKFDEIDPIGTASGAIATFETNLADVLQSLKCEINASGGGGTPSTPIPIVGHSELNLTRCGKNLCNTSLFSDGSVGGVSYAIDSEGKITVNAPSAIATAQRIDIGEMTLPAGTYTLTGIKTDINYIDLRLRTNISLGSTEFAVCNSNNPSVTFTLSETTHFYAVFIVLPNFVGTTICEQMIRLASDTSSEYEPYNGQTFTVAFGQTVYGGVYDKSGRLTITWAGVNANSLSWEFSSEDNHIFRTTISDIKPTQSYDDRQKGVICSHYPADTQISISSNMHNETWLRGSNQFFIRNNAYSDVNDFVASLSDVMIAYELATPIVIDVQAISPSAVVGTNNVFGDTGDTEVEYLKGSMAEDIKTVIGTTKFADLSDIPNPPTTDGNYRLIVTIADGKPTYSWEEITE